MVNRYILQERFNIFSIYDTEKEVIVASNENKFTIMNLLIKLNKEVE